MHDICHPFLLLILLVCLSGCSLDTPELEGSHDQSLTPTERIHLAKPPFEGAPVAPSRKVSPLPTVSRTFLNSAQKQ